MDYIRCIVIGGGPMTASEELFYESFPFRISCVLEYDNLDIDAAERHSDNCVRALYDKILSTFVHDKIRCVDVNNKSYNSICEYYNSADKYMLPESLQIYHNEVVICSIHLENWYMVGGPEPYHDSLTITLLLRDKISSMHMAENLEAYSKFIQDKKPERIYLDLFHEKKTRWYERLWSSKGSVRQRWRSESCADLKKHT